MAENTTGDVDHEAPPERSEHVKVTRLNPGEAPTFYANNVSFRTLFWDFALDFGQVVDISEEAGLIIRDVATVVMAPQHARVFAEVLLRNVRAYEEQFGPIPRPPEADAGQPGGGREEPAGE